MTITAEEDLWLTYETWREGYIGRGHGGSGSGLLKKGREPQGVHDCWEISTASMAH
jgi:hypothetical protein